MGSRLKLHGPVQMSMEVHGVLGDQIAKVTFTFPFGKFPTQEEIQAGIEKAMDQVHESHPDVRLMTKREFWDHMMEEFTGTNERFAMEGHEVEWDKP